MRRKTETEKETTLQGTETRRDSIRAGDLGFRDQITRTNGYPHRDAPGRTVRITMGGH